MKLNPPYDVLYIDPPWAFRVWSKDTGHGRSAEAHYKTLDWEDLFDLPILDLLSRDGVAFVWVTNSSQNEAMDIVQHGWELEYITKGFTWAKITETGKDAFGMGYYTRQNTESCLLFKRPGGKPYIDDHSIREYQKLLIRSHSEKPPEFRTLIRKLMGKGVKRLEIFARPNPYDTTYKGWDLIGNEVDGQDIRVQLPEVLRETGIWKPDQTKRKRLNPTLTYGAVRALQLGRAFVVELQSDVPETKTALKRKLSAPLVLENNPLLSLIGQSPSASELSYLLRMLRFSRQMGKLMEPEDNFWSNYLPAKSL